jgi:lipid-binding SYLF domain-containing protein
MTQSRRTLIAAGLATLAVAGAAAPAAHADSAVKLAAAGHRALASLLANEPKARLFSKSAVAVMVFPHIYKAGFVVGAQTGDGVLFEHGRATRYYNISAASFGLQAGGQAFSYALFFMNPGALAYIHKSDGWAIGTGPSVVVIDKGESREANSETLSHDVYAFPFAEKGLMAGIDIKGSKITRIHPK